MGATGDAKVPETRDLIVLIFVVGARLLVPLAIPKYPLPAGIAALIIDGVDQTIFQKFTRLDLVGYQSYDKALDIYYLSIEYLSTLRNWTNLSAFRMSRLLFYYRLIGSLLFELTHIRALLLLFPNTFEYVFLLYEAVRLRWNPRRLTPALIIGAAFAIWVFVKIPQEYWIHIARLDATDTIKLRLFRVPIDTRWSTIVVEHPATVAGLLILAIALIAALRWFIVNRLPPADWRFSFDADAHGHDVDPEEARMAQRLHARTPFDAAFVEKIALVSLVSIIFSQVLPSARATVPQTAAGVAIVIVANTLISDWLLRHGVHWRSAPREFAAMAVINIVIAALFVVVLPLQGGQLDLPAALFSLLLLTLLVTLYDRYRPYYQIRLSRARLAPSPVAATTANDPR
jgi:hypothetical protein